MFFKLVSDLVDKVNVPMSNTGFPRFIIRNPEVADEYQSIKGIKPLLSYKNLFSGMFLVDSAPPIPKVFVRKYSDLLNITTSPKSNQEAIRLIFEKFLMPSNSEETLPNNTNILWLYGAETESRQFNWVDSFVKTSVEALGLGVTKSKKMVTQILELWTDLIKMSDSKLKQYFLLRHMDTLTSNLIKTICINYCLKSPINLALEDESLAVKRNRAFLKVAKSILPGNEDFDQDTLREIIFSSISAGICFFSSDDIKNKRIRDISFKLSEQLGHNIQWKLMINHLDSFAQKIISAKEISIVLDDNGEVAFDIAVIKVILKMNKKLKVNLIINEERVSNNADIAVFREMIKDSYFEDIRKALDEKRIELIPQKIYLESYYVHLLTDRAIEALKSSDFAYVKGQMFFETFDPGEYCDAFYCFVASSSTSSMHTGVPKGSGIFAYIKKGQSKFIVEQRKRVTKTLNELMVVRKKQG